MPRLFAKVTEEEIEEALLYPSDLVNTKTAIPLRVGEERWIYTSTLRVSVYIHHYSPPLRGIVVYYKQFLVTENVKVWTCATALQIDDHSSYYSLIDFCHTTQNFKVTNILPQDRP